MKGDNHGHFQPTCQRLNSKSGRTGVRMNERRPVFSHLPKEERIVPEYLERNLLAEVPSLVSIRIVTNHHARDGRDIQTGR